MKKLSLYVFLGLMICSSTFADILKLKCNQDYERLIGSSKFEKYWLPKNKIFYTFNLEKMTLDEIGLGKEKVKKSAEIKYWLDETTKEKLIRGAVSGSGKTSKGKQYRVYAFTISKTTNNKYSHVLTMFRVSVDFFNDWENSNNQTYEALEKLIDFENEFLVENASGVVKGKCRILK